MSKILIIHTAVILTAPWWWVIVSRNIWMAILVLSLSFALVFWVYERQSRKSLVLVLILTVFLSIAGLKQAFDESILRTSALEIQQLNRRHEFYAHGLGKLYKNRFTLKYFRDYNFPLSKLQRNLFTNLDPNLYFFKSHPRERSGMEEFEKYLPIFLPFFLIGILYSLYALLSEFLIYSVSILLLSSIVSPSYNLGPILFFPIINSLITIGIILSFKEALKYIKFGK